MLTNPNFFIGNPQMPHFPSTLSEFNNISPLSNGHLINEWEVSIPDYTIPDLQNNSFTTQKNYTIIGLGTPCLDIVYRVGSLFLEKYGLKIGDWQSMT